jgi:hypothetical protein
VLGEQIVSESDGFSALAPREEPQQATVEVARRGLM